MLFMGNVSEMYSIEVVFGRIMLFMGNVSGMYSIEVVFGAIMGWIFLFVGSV
jgi:hypothetical protein